MTREVRVHIGERTYTVTVTATTTVIDLLEQIRLEHEPSLAYRHSCHHGSCGTCGLMVNDTPRLACLTNVTEVLEAAESDDLHLAPLAGFPVIKDLVVDTSAIQASFPDGTPAHEPLVAGGHQTDDARRPAYRLSLCIECGLCVAACPVAGAFQGPAALAAVNRTRKAFPDREAEMLDRAALPDGVAACEQHFACSRVCPTGVAPGRQITELRTALKQRDS